MKSKGLIIALTTLPDDAAASALARTLVEERLAACVQRTAIASTYLWEGTIEEQPEVVLLIKTAAERADDLRRRVLELHPYDTPEYVVLEGRETAEKYLAWAAAATQR